MNVQIAGRKVVVDDELRDHVNRRLKFAIGRFTKRVAEVRVALSDVNGPKGGPDKRCRITLEIIPSGGLMAEETQADLFAAVSGAAERVKHALKRELERRRSGRSRARAQAAKAE
ncbi:MAG: ribosome-associated translation inhibitor RaiA [Phycisphaerae bacterium]